MFTFYLQWLIVSRIFSHLVRSIAKPLAAAHKTSVLQWRKRKPRWKIFSRESGITLYTVPKGNLSASLWDVEMRMDSYITLYKQKSEHNYVHFVQYSMKRNWINTLDAQITRFRTWNDWVKRESLRKGFLKWACLNSLFPQAKLQILIYKVQVVVKATLKKLLYSARKEFDYTYTSWLLFQRKCYLQPVELFAIL